MVQEGTTEGATHLTNTNTIITTTSSITKMGTSLEVGTITMAVAVEVAAEEGVAVETATRAIQTM